MHETPPMMRALVLDAVDQPPVWREVPRPEPGPGQVRVRVEAAALNHRDVWIWRGKYPGIRTPITLGSDGTGVVDAVGEGVSAARIGQAVVLCPSIGWGPDEAAQAPEFSILGLPAPGTFAEQVVIAAELAFARPAHLTVEEAAALPLAGLTAWRALVTRAGLQPDERILITGAGGGVSMQATQLAVALGAEVWVTSSDPSKIDRAVSLGARGGALYTDRGWPAALRAEAGAGFNVVLDGAGGEGVGDLLSLLAPAGRFVFYGGTRGKWPALLPQLLFYRQVSLLATTMGSPLEFALLLDAVSKHRLRPLIDRVLPLEQGDTAFAYLESGRQCGKVVLRVT